MEGDKVYLVNDQVTVKRVIDGRAADLVTVVADHLNVLIVANEAGVRFSVKLANTTYVNPYNSVRIKQKKIIIKKTKIKIVCL
ncbi:hypothetical protein [Arachidicoccus terrestris]|uniref:hypothetical protein n=1 Tax=Arachidicoccus terrestris TaxID=2875539 RepID=UPI001CC67EBA|nr:hypothetical protein [Arachidicoccus terrestris]UAY56232.1 hypothetical protein K9M52_04230 [Arachidicoccus terrestris]